MVAAIAFPLYFGTTLLSQGASGAFSASFVPEPDEASHYITSVMVTDYLRSGAASPPREFAQKYYLHYPRVAFGIWPPLYHVTQGLWLFLVSPMRWSALAFNAVCVAGLATLLFHLARGECGDCAALLSGCLLVSLPLVQTFLGMVMADPFVALLSLCAVVSFGRYLDRVRWQDAAAFGVFSALAILTKYDALALALLPVLSLVISRRWELLWRFSFWLPALLVGAVCMPWYVFNWHLVLYAMESSPGDTVTIWQAFTGRLLQLVEVVGITVFAVAAVGIAVRLRYPTRARGQSITAAAWIASVWLFHSIGYANLEVRYLLAAVPSMLLFFVAGLSWLTRYAPITFLAAPQRTAVLLAVVTLVYARTALATPDWPRDALATAAQDVVGRPEYRQAVVLVSSERPGGEGIFISEVAMREQRPGHVVARASKVLAKQRIMGGGYELRHRSPRELMHFLDAVPITVIVVDTAVSVSKQPHHELLLETIRNHPEQWRLVRNYQNVSQAGKTASIEMYERLGGSSRPFRGLEIDMSETLNKVLGR